MQILKNTGADWSERRFISKLCKDQSVKYNQTKETQEVCRLEEELDKDTVLSSILFSLYSKDLTKQGAEGFEDFRIGREDICTVKYADDLVLMAKDETTLQRMIDRLIENEKKLCTGNKCGKELRW